VEGLVDTIAAIFSADEKKVLSSEGTPSGGAER